jgi:hypothetical protein
VPPMSRGMLLADGAADGLLGGACYSSRGCWAGLAGAEAAAAVAGWACVLGGSWLAGPRPPRRASYYVCVHPAAVGRSKSSPRMGDRRATVPAAAWAGPRPLPHAQLACPAAPVCMKGDEVGTFVGFTVQQAGRPPLQAQTHAQPSHEQERGAESPTSEMS